MGLLETRNKKFNIPFVFIAGALFLIGLAYFANYLENISNSGLNLELPKATGEIENVKDISILITENLNVYIDSIQVDIAKIEETLKVQFEGHANPKILLQAEEGVSIEKMVNIMEIANRNQYKVILKVAAQ